MSRKRVLVAGDVIWDENTVRSKAGRGPSALPHVITDRQPGGAWYLTELMAEACAGLDVDVEGPPEDPTAGRAFYSWAPYEVTTGNRRLVYRTEQFLGLQPRTVAALTGSQEGPAPDVLLIDDLGLGFSSTRAAWPACLRQGDGPKAIVLKCSIPLAEGPLWEELISRFADRLTLVLSASQLRSRPAPLSQAVSWDRSIEETLRELESGASAHDLGRARNVFVRFGLSGLAAFNRPAGDTRVRFERFFYHPESLEGAWEAKRPGTVFGSGSILTVAAARYLLDAGSLPLYIAMGRGLAAARANHEAGGGAADQFRGSDGRKAAAAVLGAPLTGPEPALAFYAAFPPHLLASPTPADCPFRSDILAAAAGAGFEYLVAKGTEVILRGPEQALTGVPRARYGKFLTVDREEIERINSIRNLIRAYLANEKDRRPLSLAVFGPPGSGKSFAIKQLATELLGSRPLMMEFNLSQFEDADDLHKAFHRVRDGSVQAQVPLVFWDEFDSEELRWLKDFLAPMQDAEFRSHGAIYPFGKAIFIFAGGTCSDFGGFDRSSAGGETELRFRARKGPDFVSRLRGFVNIKGPNRIGTPGREESGDAHVIRRALIFRSTLERLHGHLIDPETQTAAVAASVADAFLRVERFVHGARSLEAVVTMSDLSGASQYGPAELPSADALSLHVTPDFHECLNLAQLAAPVVEALAAACHEAWREAKSLTGASHPLLRPYSELNEVEKERSRVTARLTRAKLNSSGFRIVSSGTPGVLSGFSKPQLDLLMRLEHDIWMRDRLMRGYAWAAATDERLHLHRDLVPFEQLGPDEQQLDRAIAESIPATLLRHGFGVALV